MYKSICKFLLIVLFIVNIKCDDKYNHETFILCNNGIKGFPLSNRIKNISYNAYSYLNCSKFFDTSFITDSLKVQLEFAKDPTHSEIIIETSDKQKLTCSFFNRKKNKIIIIGPGFTNSKEKMAPFVHIFNDYDILILNFRGHGYKKGFSLDIFYNLFGVGSNAKLGMHEEEEVFAAIKYARNLKKYENVIGLGICFGAFIIAKAQGIAEDKNILAFDKIIIDGCWPSLKEFVETIKKDPQLINDPQRGGASNEIKWLFDKKIVSNSIVSTIQTITNIDFEKVNIRDYLRKIKKTPVLFFYGKDDLTISRNEFEDLWKNTSSPNKLCIITSNPHVHNHLRSKENYKLICELFIEKEKIEYVTELLFDPEKLTKDLLNKFNNQLNSLANITKPIKLEKKSHWLQQIFAYKLTALFFGALYASYKIGKINSDTFLKIAKAYGIYKFIALTWRPTINIISKF